MLENRYFRPSPLPLSSLVTTVAVDYVNGHFAVWPTRRPTVPHFSTVIPSPRLPHCSIKFVCTIEHREKLQEKNEMWNESEHRIGDFLCVTMIPILFFFFLCDNELASNLFIDWCSELCFLVQATTYRSVVDRGYSARKTEPTTQRSARGSPSELLAVVHSCGKLIDNSLESWIPPLSQTFPTVLPSLYTARKGQRCWWETIGK